MKKEEKYLLSICIPTYNRADVLRHCIDAIVNHEQAKKGGIEIVVCDNDSTDNTQQMMSEYAQQYPYIIYIRNKENLGVILNTLKVLDSATGAYRKLLNDYSVYTADGLQKMYNQIAANEKDRPVLMFDNLAGREPNEFSFSTMDEIAHRVGVRLTWMGLYGYWEEDWKAIKNREAYFDKTFCTIDYLYQMVNKKKIAKECIFHYNDVWTYKRKQGGYNFFKVFIQDYLEIWKEYLKKSIITKDTYNKLTEELWQFSWQYTIKLLIKKQGENFNSQNGWRLLLRYFGNERCFWRDLFSYPFGVVKRKIKKLI